MRTETALESVVKRDRLIIAAGLAAIWLLASVYLFRLAATMSAMEMHLAMPEMHPWGLTEVGLLFVMWMIMMIAMMLPAASPMILLFITVNRKRGEDDARVLRTWVFLAGYLAVWMAYSGVAALAQWGLHTAALLSGAMASTGPVFGGGLLIAAGIFQWTPLKSACLARCRSPLGFLMTEWRRGAGGAFVMGLRHGMYCVGCCWVLMALLFVAGVMNLLWVAALAAFVLVEKVLPYGEWSARAAGMLLVIAGLFVLVGTRG